MNGKFINNDEENKCCKSCAYFKKLKLFRRTIKEIENNNIVSGFKIVQSKSIDEDSYCCTLLISKDLDAPIYETIPSDICENYVRLISCIDDTSMYGQTMITSRLFSNICEDKLKEIYNSRNR